MRPGSSLFLLAASLAPALWGDVTVRYHAQAKFGAAIPEPIVQRTRNGGLGLPEDTEIYRRGDKQFIRSGKFACLVDLGKQTVTLLDEEHKQYATAKIAAFIDQVAAALPPLAPDYKDAQAASKSKVSSRRTGRTAEIKRVTIEETEYTVDVEVPTPPIPGFTPTLPLFRIRLQVWTPAAAEDRDTPMVRELAALGLPDTRFSPVIDPAHIIAEIYSAMPGLGPAWNQLLQEVAKTKPMIFRYRVETSQPGMVEFAEFQRKSQPTPAAPQADLSVPLHVIEGEMLQILPQASDDNLFQIPATYKSAPFEDVLKAIEPDYPKS